MNEQIIEQEILEPQAPQRSLVAEQSTVALLNKSEIDQQIATAHAYPRSIKRFRDEALQMVTLSESIARECIYSLPRDGKVIEGPSARFAEIVQSAWGNCRAGARVVNEGNDFITAQGVFHDLEKNAAITYEVQRRITDRKGRRYKADMIGVTGNAACSIALRNAILKGIPKAFWLDMYDAARRTVMGDFKTLPNRRAAAMEAFKAYGVTDAEIYALLQVKGKEDIGLEHLVTLHGVLTALKEGDTTPEEAFNRKPPQAPSAPQAPEAPAAPKQEAKKDEPKKQTRKKGEARTDRTPYADKAKATDHDPETGEVVEDDQPFDPDAWLDGLESMLAGCADQDTLDEVWNAYAQPLIEKGAVMKPDREKAEEMWERHVSRVEGDDSPA
jgi:hypothetical protein